MEPISPPRQRVAGHVLSALAILFPAFDATGKLLMLGPVVSGSAELGYPEQTIVPMGLLLLFGVALYALPRTSVLGAIYLTAYLGGAVATHVRVGSPLLTHALFPTYVAAFVWGGLVLRRPELLGALQARRITVIPRGAEPLAP